MVASIVAPAPLTVLTAACRSLHDVVADLAAGRADLGTCALNTDDLIEYAEATAGFTSAAPVASVDPHRTSPSLATATALLGSVYAQLAQSSGGPPAVAVVALAHCAVDLVFARVPLPPDPGPVRPPPEDDVWAREIYCPESCVAAVAAHPLAKVYDLVPVATFEEAARRLRALPAHAQRSRLAVATFRTLDAFDLEIVRGDAPRSLRSVEKVAPGNADDVGSERAWHWGCDIKVVRLSAARTGPGHRQAGGP